ncbi:hypothetical protein QJS10_CPA01g02672 [Acorus calamus]|uniref:Uncharacterized protein n=1 Tax=Acorus calamus TaxID=4465 RepID=A0AAV9FFY6_ACOCL|nr:hypothetical protein QJS10_CPA01g02672 [Acorus calamus]
MRLTSVRRIPRSASRLEPFRSSRVHNLRTGRQWGASSCPHATSSPARRHQGRHGHDTVREGGVVVAEHLLRHGSGGLHEVHDQLFAAHAEAEYGSVFARDLGGGGRHDGGRGDSPAEGGLWVPGWSRLTVSPASVLDKGHVREDDGQCHHESEYGPPKLVRAGAIDK